MFCRKCGEKIFDDSVFCPKCGTKIETGTKSSTPNVVPEDKENTNIPQQGDIITDENLGADEACASQEHNELVTSPNMKKDGKAIKIIVSAVVVAVVLIVSLILIIFSIINSGRCEYDDCSNEKMEGADYCYSHLCTYTDCNLCKGYNSDYCYLHKCSTLLCNNCITNDSEYCNTHSCHAPGCNDEVEENSSYCSKHKINMSSRLASPSMRFRLNSAGGIEFSFSATNKSGKTIKYVRFNAYLKNAVGDPIQEEITGDYYAGVEIIGPISNGETVIMISEIIGYCDNLARIDISDITVVYTDGNSENGPYNYYCTK